VITVRRKLVLTRTPDRPRALVAQEARPEPVAVSGRVPRVARLMALAIHCDRLIREQTIADLSALARLLHVTQPRVTQIMNLNHLAPDIQEQLLHLPLVERGRDPMNERDLRPIAALMRWTEQRVLWRAMVRSQPSPML
jgi:hypothetical protein